MNTRLYVVLLVSSFGLMILGAVAGGILESSGRVTRESLGPRGIAIVCTVYMALYRETVRPNLQAGRRPAGRPDP